MKPGEARERLLAMLSGYWPSQCLYVLAELGIPDRLAGGPRTAGELAAGSGCDPATLRRFLRALASAGVLRGVPPDRFAGTALSELLREETVGSLRPLALLGGHPDHWRAWGGLLAAVRDGRPAFDTVHGERLFERLRRDPALAAVFHGTQSLHAALGTDLLAAMELGRFRHLVDVGGGAGALAEQLAAHCPDARVTCVDRPGAAARTAGDGRVEHVVGDFFEAVPRGADAYLLKHVLHDWDDADVLRILRCCRRAMRPEARLFVVETLLPSGGEPSYAALHDLNMLVLTGGREREAAEYRALLAAAGLEPLREIAAHGPVSALEARAPAAA